MFLSTEKQIPVQLTFCPPNNIRIPYKSLLRIYTETVEQGKKVNTPDQKNTKCFFPSVLVISVLKKASEC